MGEEKEIREEVDAHTVRVREKVDTIRGRSKIVKDLLSNHNQEDSIMPILDMKVKV